MARPQQSRLWVLMVWAVLVWVSCAAPLAEPHSVCIVDSTHDTRATSMFARGTMRRCAAVPIDDAVVATPEPQAAERAGERGRHA